MRVHHVQVSCPTGGEDAARSFWQGAFGMTEVPKPAALTGRGGCWFRTFGPIDATGERPVLAEIHVGVEESFTPARKAHPAFVLEAAEFDALAERLASGGFEVNHTERETFEGHLRFHCSDPFGNRVELLTALG